MKLFQIFKGFCHYDMTNLYSTIEMARSNYPSDVLIVEAPDYVFEGWGYDETKEGDERFIQPTPPEGWLYDEKTGTFYQEGEIAPSDIPTEAEQLRADLDYLSIMTGVELK